MDDSALADRFHRAMVGIYEVAKRDLGYNAGRFVQMVAEMGGVAAAVRLVQSQDPSEGFTKLWEMGRLDLTVEAHVVDPQYRELFDASTIRAARLRLTAYSFDPIPTDRT